MLITIAADAVSLFHPCRFTGVIHWLVTLLLRWCWSSVTARRCLSTWSIPPTTRARSPRRVTAPGLWGCRGEARPRSPWLTRVFPLVSVISFSAVHYQIRACVIDETVTSVHEGTSSRVGIARSMVGEEEVYCRGQCVRLDPLARSLSI